MPQVLGRHSRPERCCGFHAERSAEMPEERSDIWQRGNPGLEQSESQGAALAVGVCPPSAANPGHAGWTIGGLDNTVCFTPVHRLKLSVWARPPCGEADFPGLYSMARCLKNRAYPRPTQPWVRTGVWVGFVAWVFGLYW